MTRERCVDALRAASSREADDEADAYYAALSLHRALATRANRDDDEAMARCVATCEEVVERYARRRGGRDGAMRRETVALAALTVARARGPAAAAETLRGGDERASVLGAAVARWLALRLVDVDAERELTVADLTRLAVILSKARDSRAATAFCECGGVSSLCALIDVESSPPLSAGTIFDCAKAIAGFCAALSDGSTTARFDVEGVSRELRAILSSASGKMADPLPAVAATACRRALACLEKHAATRAGAATAVERQSSYGALGDCVPRPTASSTSPTPRARVRTPVYTARKNTTVRLDRKSISRARARNRSTPWMPRLVRRRSSSPRRPFPKPPTPPPRSSPPHRRSRENDPTPAHHLCSSPSPRRARARRSAPSRFAASSLFVFAVGVVFAFADRLRAHRA